MEAVSDLSSQKFIQALKRLIGRRGYPTKIYCDNATNFVGAKKILQEFHDQFFSQQHLSEVTAFCSQRCIEFEFIPPRAPHFGGIWESAVKVAKTHLLKSLSSAHLTYEELSTALIEIEAIMNSRPLSPASGDPDDLSALTPGHFLIGCPLKAIPEPQPLHSDLSHLQRWQRINAIKHHFWQRWQREYLQELQNRTKWKQPQKNVEVGRLVLIYEDNTPSLHWALGRITKVFQGSDGFVRVAEVKTVNGVKTRPIAKLALLPIVEGVPSKGPGCSRACPTYK